jgi:hypothetical protein
VKALEDGSESQTFTSPKVSQSPNNSETRRHLKLKATGWGSDTLALQSYDIIALRLQFLLLQS